MYYRQVMKQQVSRLSVDDVKTTRRLDTEQLEGLERFFQFTEGTKGMDTVMGGAVPDAVSTGISNAVGTSSMSTEAAGAIQILDDCRDMDTLQVDDEEQGAPGGGGNRQTSTIKSHKKQELEKKPTSGSIFDLLLGVKGSSEEETEYDKMNRQRLQEVAGTNPTTSGTTGVHHLPKHLPSASNGQQPAQASSKTRKSLVQSPAREADILGNCQQFMHDEYMRHDSQEELLAEEARELYGEPEHDDVDAKRRKV
ncbi:unnamed protein product [Amoebophrya sp. A25]|nr:unnamed protein product [Amoebophrya sp. A25]|eukprot:GSA25T00008315001.1